MWRHVLFFILVVSPIHTFAEEREESERYWTYQEFSELFRESQKFSDKFSSKVSAKGEPNQETLRDPIRIAIIYPGKQASDYWRRSVSSFEARLIESAIPYEVRIFFSKPGSEIRLQEGQVFESLQYDPDYLVFTLDALKHRVIIERLMAQKRPKVILQNITTPLRQWGNTQPFMYVGFDHASGTGILAEGYRKRFGGQARFAIFYGLRGYVSQMRGGTFKTLMRQEQGMKLVAEYYTGFNREKAREAALQLLTEQPNLDFIFSSSTDIALGVIDAINTKGKKGQVITNGWGGGSAELEAIANGELDLTVMRMNDDNGAAMAEAILWQIQGASVPTIYSGDMLLVTKEMTKSEIDRLVVRAFRYSDKWTSDLEKILKREN
jgi:autoinducer 2-binding periplasmic protein LuxP